MSCQVARPGCRCVRDVGAARIGRVSHQGCVQVVGGRFADYELLIEPGPQNEARALAGIAETKRLSPAKLTRFCVITHHHFDHGGGLQLADGLVVPWLPKEKLLVYADMFNFQPASQPVADPPVIGTRIFVENLTRLGIDPEKILSIHTMNPDRLATMQDIRATMGVAN
jgi:glyoxylase-like metal-dependent hydrolase (beta-lactamase superfamily II)